MTNKQIIESIPEQPKKYQAYVLGYGKYKPNWYNITEMIKIKADYTVRVSLDTVSGIWLPNRVIKEIRLKP
jgi:hypothetical protein